MHHFSTAIIFIFESKKFQKKSHGSGQRHVSSPIEIVYKI